jgi:hypothetical protein
VRRFKASKLSSRQHRLPDRLRQFNLAEERLWIKIILAGLVDDPQKIMLLGSRVAQRD